MYWDLWETLRELKATILRFGFHVFDGQSGFHGFPCMDDEVEAAPLDMALMLLRCDVLPPPLLLRDEKRDDGPPPPPPPPIMLSSRCWLSFSMSFLSKVVLRDMVDMRLDVDAIDEALDICERLVLVAPAPAPPRAVVTAYEAGKMPSIRPSGNFLDASLRPCCCCSFCT